MAYICMYSLRSTELNINLVSEYINILKAKLVLKAMPLLPAIVT